MKRNWLLFPLRQGRRALLFIALTTGTVLFCCSTAGRSLRPTWSSPRSRQNHYEAYLQVVGQFEAQHQCKVQMQLVPARGIAEPPAVGVSGECRSARRGRDPERLDGYFHPRGPPMMSASRPPTTPRERPTTPWWLRGSPSGPAADASSDASRRHPVTLAYRADIVEGELGIDVGQVDTWDKFTAPGRRLTIDKDGDGVSTST
ncbi:MAG: hypothetical protein M5U09_25290 [Gammaproteobacteria bacterium]|nr:hypothetical protein [Gammaproteobacteria bacterium]